MVEAARVAEDLEAKIVLADRDVRVTNAHGGDYPFGESGSSAAS